MQRQLVVWCPDLLEQHEHGREARAFARVLGAVGEFCPHVDAVRPGVCVLVTRGPSRYFGGDEALAGLIATAVANESDASETGHEGVTAGVGVADGLFGAALAARLALGEILAERRPDQEVPAPLPPVVVPSGETPAFLAPWPVAVLDRPELADLLVRLGIRTLGDLAGLPSRHVLARFGGDGAACHAVAAGIEGELPGLRLRPGSRPRNHPEQGLPAGQVRQTGFFGGDAGADARATRTVAALQRLLHPEAVVRGRLQGGRGPAERACLVPFGEELAGANLDAARDGEPPGRFRGNVPGTSNARSTTHQDAATPPWPGQVPPPSPVLVPAQPLHAALVDTGGHAVAVSAAGLASAAPARLSVAGGPWAEVAQWAGPWPCDERWWSRHGRRRQARVQVITADGTAYLLLRRRGWWVEGIYD